MSRLSDIDLQLAAMGVMMTAVPEVAELVSYRASLGPDLSSEAVHELVIERALELGLSPGGAPVAAEVSVSASLLDASLWDLLAQGLTILRAQHGEMTGREALRRLSAWTGMEDALVRYVEQSAASGSPAAFPLPVHGGVSPLPGVDIGSFSIPPVVVLVATQFSDLDELCRDLRDQAHTTFKDRSSPRLETWQELARMTELMAQGMSRKEITWQLLADKFPEIAAASDEERKRDYGELYKRKRASLYRKFNRLDKGM